MIVAITTDYCFHPPPTLRLDAGVFRGFLDKDTTKNVVNNEKVCTRLEGKLFSVGGTTSCYCVLSFHFFNALFNKPNIIIFANAHVRILASATNLRYMTCTLATLIKSIYFATVGICA